MELTIEDIGKIALIIFGAFGTIYQWRNWKLTSRSSIKTDLEILNLIDKSDQNYSLVKDSVDSSLEKAYSKTNKKFKIHNRIDFTFGIIFILVFGYLTYDISKDNLSIYSLIMFMFVISGIGGVMSSLNPKFSKNRVR